MSTSENTIIILDIDGTLVVDGSNSLTEESRRLVGECKSRGSVYLCSNGEARRTERFAQELGVLPLVPCSKPFTKITDRFRGKEVYVVGDRLLTDGLFAVRNKAVFEKRTRLETGEEALFIKFLYRLDDGLLFLLRCMHLMRAHQWGKNVLIFAPLFFSASLFAEGMVQAAVYAFVLFCALSSLLYVFNDIRDVDADRKHPEKKKRPLAAGEISLSAAYGLIAALCMVAGALLFFMPTLVPYAGAFLLLNSAYSLFLKHVAVADITTVATSYVVRVVAGGAAIGVLVSPWIILCTFFAALFLITGKRLGELSRGLKETRTVLTVYTVPIMQAVMGSALTLAVMSYALYSVVAATSPRAAYSTLLVIVALLSVYVHTMRFPADAEYPERLIFKDPVARYATLLWVVFMLVLIYTPL